MHPARLPAILLEVLANGAPGTVQVAVTTDSQWYVRERSYVDCQPQHAAFAVLERVRSFTEDTGQRFEGALAVARVGNLFTTHTAVAAGFDRFAPALIEQYLGGYAQQKLGITLRDLLALGRQNPDDLSESFNMSMA